MEAHDRRPVARKGGVGRGKDEAETRRLFDKLAEAVAALPPDRRQALTERLEGDMLADDLKTAILESGRSSYSIATEAGVRPEILTRFINGERDMRLETAGKLAAVLGLGLRPIDQSSQAPAIAKAAEVPKSATRKATKRAPGGRKPKK